MAYIHEFKNAHSLHCRKVAFEGFSEVFLIIGVAFRLLY